MGKVSWEKSQKSTLKLSNLKASFLSVTVALSWVTVEASGCISQHSQHLSRPGATPPAQPSLGCHLLGRLLTAQSRRSLLYFMTIHQFLFSQQAELLLRTEQNGRSKSGKETLKIKQCWYMDVLPDKGMDLCIQMLPAKTKTSSEKDKFSLWRHVLPFHKHPSSGRCLQESHDGPLVCSVCSWEHLSAPGATTLAARCDTAGRATEGWDSPPL